MKIPAGAQSVLREAEKHLKDQIQKALRDERYDDVTSIAALAEALMQLRIAGLPFQEERTSDKSVKGPADQQVVQRFLETGRAATPSEKRLRVASKEGSTKKYPRFERDSTRLIKVGWSKKRKAEYEHRVPLDITAIVVDRLKDAAANGRRFEVEELLPIVTDNGEEIPAYQIYAVIAWLRGKLVIERIGRDGYLMKHGLEAPETFDRLWGELPERA